MYVFACMYIICNDHLIAAGAPRLTVNHTTLTCLLYPTLHKLITSFNNSKLKLRTKFCQRKSYLRIDSRMCHFKDNRDIWNHPVYTLRNKIKGSLKISVKKGQIQIHVSAKKGRRAMFKKAF